MTHSLETVPPELQGLWQRTGLLRGENDQPMTDYCNVLWFQSPSWYADVRLRRNPAEMPAPDDELAVNFAKERAFAGTAMWNPPEVTWEHVLDSKHSSEIDSQPIGWLSDNIIIERGEKTLSSGLVMPWAEVWTRDPNQTRAIVEPSDNYLFLSIGSMAVEIRDGRAEGGMFDAALLGVQNGNWSVIGSLQAA